MNKIEEFIQQQTKLPIEFENILFDNLWELYSRDESKMIEKCSCGGLFTILNKIWSCNPPKIIYKCNNCGKTKSTSE